MNYPSTASDRAHFILERRVSKHRLDPHRAYGAFVEEEPDGLGGTVSVATILLTNRECPWKCVFCDLWINTLDETVSAGAIAEQLRAALADLPPARWIKLYNAGSFFDPRAIPPGEFPAIADLLTPFERVIVESHPALIHGGASSHVLSLRDRLRNRTSTPTSRDSSPDRAGDRPARSVDASDSSAAAHYPDCVPLETDAPEVGPSSRLEAVKALEAVHPHALLAKNLDRNSLSRKAPSPGVAPERGGELFATLDGLARSAACSPKVSPTLPSSPRDDSRRLEVAMGLETVHALALERMNKGMTLDDFARAADVLRRAEIDLRAFVLVQPPFVPPDEAVFWALRSIDFAREHGARLVALIPTRGGNGAMEALRETGDFVPPRLSTLEESLDRALEGVAQHGGPIVVADLWDLDRFSDCTSCFPAREARLRRMNLTQKIDPRVPCSCSPPRIAGATY